MKRKSLVPGKSAHATYMLEKGRQSKMSVKLLTQSSVHKRYVGV